MRRRHTATRRDRSLRRRRRRIQRGGGPTPLDWRNQFLALINKQKEAGYTDLQTINFAAFSDNQLSMIAVKDDPAYRIRIGEQEVSLFDIAVSAKVVLERGITTAASYKKVYDMVKSNPVEYRDYLPTFEFIAFAEKEARKIIFGSVEPAEFGGALPAETSPVVMLAMVANMPPDAAPSAPVLEPRTGAS